MFGGDIYGGEYTVLEITSIDFRDPVQWPNCTLEVFQGKKEYSSDQIMANCL